MCATCLILSLNGTIPTLRCRVAFFSSFAGCHVWEHMFHLALSWYQRSSSHKHPWDSLVIAWLFSKQVQGALLDLTRATKNAPWKLKFLSWSFKAAFHGFFHRQRHSETDWFVTSSFPAVSNCFCWPFPSERKGSLQILLFWLFPSDQKGRADPNFACFCQTVELSQLYDLKCARRPVKYDVVFEIVELTHFRKSCLDILLIRIQLYDFEKNIVFYGV